MSKEYDLCYSTHQVNTQYCIAWSPHFVSGLCRISPDRCGNMRGSYGYSGKGIPTCRHCKKVWKNMSQDEKEKYNRMFKEW